MDQKTLIRACALYEFDQGYLTTEVARNIGNTYGADAIGDSSCRRWFARFRDGQRNLQDLPRKGQPEFLDR